MIKVGIIGSTGYAGQEIVRILLRHPEDKIVWYGSRSYIDKRYSEVFGNMFRLVEDVCKGENMQELADQKAKLTGCVLNDTPAVSHSKRYGYGQYIMHRVCRVNPDGSLDISGDAQCVMECGVPREAVFARVVEAERDGKMIAPGDRCWNFFSGFWVDSFAVRPLLLRGGSAVMRIIKSFRGESDGSGQRKKE